MSRICKAYQLRIRQRLRDQGVDSIDDEMKRLLEQAQRSSKEEGMTLAEALARIEKQVIAAHPQPFVGNSGERERLFLCDSGLGGLARWLRAGGQQAIWSPGIDDDELVREATRLAATVLTTDSIMMERKVFRDRWIPSLWLPPTLRVREQLAIVFREFGLQAGEPRCMTCGGELRREDREALKARIPPRTYRWLDEYFVCIQCGKLFWKGTHWERIDSELRKAGVKLESVR